MLLGQKGGSTVGPPYKKNFGFTYESSKRANYLFSSLFGLSLICLREWIRP